MSSKVDLKLDWCSHEAAKFACEHWHYSKCMPAGKTVKVGVWEEGKYIGCVIFSSGATNEIGSPYGLTQFDVCELTRVALNKHVNSVSKIISIALAMLKKTYKGLRLIVSYADKNHNHNGAIYQAGNWAYVGMARDDAGSLIVNGVQMHGRSAGAKWGTRSLDWIKKNIDPNAIPAPTLGKHKYLMPLDKEMAKQIEPLRKPYPKKPCAGSETVTRQAIQLEEGGSIPTPALNEAPHAIQ